MLAQELITSIAMESTRLLIGDRGEASYIYLKSVSSVSVLQTVPPLLQIQRISAKSMSFNSSATVHAA
jgi:hypothetical protein